MTRESQASLSDSAALLALSETGIGSLLHAWHVPLTGYFLSLNQIFIMTRAYQKGALMWDALWISLLAASVKSLSPMGKKLTPMLAISMQGVLFNLGVIFFGSNRIGLSVGAILASFWGFLQPLLIYLFIFGDQIIDAYRLTFQSLEKYTWIPSFEALVALVVGFKAFLALVIVFLTSEKHEDWIRRLANKSSLSPKAPTSPFWGTMKDLTSLPFLGSLLISLLFFYQSEEGHVALIWNLLRPIGIGFVTFYILRKVNLIDKITELFPLDHLKKASLAIRESHFDQR